MKNRTGNELLGLLLVVAAVLAACGAQTAPPAPDQGTLPEGGAVVNVRAGEFALTLDRAELAAGTTTFVVNNSGAAPHNFAIRGNGLEETTATIDPGASATLTVDLEPGTYTVLCTIGGHDLLGMRNTLTVAAGG